MLLSAGTVTLAASKPSAANSLMFAPAVTVASPETLFTVMTASLKENALLSAPPAMMSRPLFWVVASVCTFAFTAKTRSASLKFSSVKVMSKVSPSLS